jgi:hypothetical protein
MLFVTNSSSSGVVVVSLHIIRPTFFFSNISRGYPVPSGTGPVGIQEALAKNLRVLVTCWQISVNVEKISKAKQA